ncbi:MAG TPA: chromosome segregation protein SMC, partial [Thermoanaerobaculia bacterium]|nr:chromosome segregation protein SMC [Thermoanaerobaculia bacterium]
HRQDIRLLEEGIAAHRERREAVRNEVEELRISQASLKQDAEHLAFTFREEFSREDLQAELPEHPGEPRADLAELEAELARTKAALERLGPVNILAVQEHDEQEQRYEFLTTQRADVATSVDSLKKTIKEINEASGERFNTTFHEVNKNFGEIFAHLFRGGEAEMRLLDEEDILESGIEILARPPGKRLQNLMLMSGGEKALTAIALLFALFRTKPSPFCVLDEVDAPLDDVNTTRFADLLREMSAETQFIVITHNKITMEVASTLYGVTMEEKGVSKLVSVEMEEVQPEPQLATA